VYSPTIYVWNRNAQQTVYFLPEDSEAIALSEQPESMIAKTADLQAQFGEVASGFLENLEGAEEKYLSKITGLFHHSQAPAPISPQQPEHATIVNQVPAPIPAVPTVQDTLPQQQYPNTPIQQPEQFQQAPVVQQQSTDQTLYQSAPAPKIETVNEIFSQLTQGQNVPQSAPIPASTAQSRSEILFNVEAPTQPNILVGKVRDSEKNPIQSAIMEIKDEFGRPVRALRTDSEGKFRIVTPLHDGKYSIDIEHDGYTFDQIQLEMSNRIIEPMFIEGRKLTN
jgi:hypothetical protein